MGVINPYSQPELEDKGWEFSSEGVPVKPDDGSVTMQSLDEELSTLAQVCQSLVKDGYVFAPDIRYSTQVTPVGYGRFFIDPQSSGGWTTDYLFVIPANSTSKVPKISWKTPDYTVQWAGVNIQNGAIASNKLNSELQSLVSAVSEIVSKDYVLDSTITASSTIQPKPYGRFSFIQKSAEQEGNTGVWFSKEVLVLVAPNTTALYEWRVFKNLSLAYTKWGTSNIADGAITQNKLADNSVNGDKIVNGSVDTEQLGIGAVTEEKIDDGAVSESKLGADVKKLIIDASSKSVLLQSDLTLSQTYTKAQFESLTDASFNDFSALRVGDYMRVTTNGGADEELRAVVACYDISDPQGHSITVATPNSPIAFYSYEFDAFEATVRATQVVIDTTGIANNAVTGAKIASGAVTGAKIASGAVTQAKIGASAVVTDKIKDKAITLPKLSDDVQDTLANVPKQYELTTSLGDETDMTPDAFLAKYGLSVDVIKGLRVGDSLKDGEYTYGVAGLIKTGNSFAVRLITSEEDYTFVYFTVVISDTVTVTLDTCVSQRAYDGDNPLITGHAFDYSVEQRQNAFSNLGLKVVYLANDEFGTTLSTQRATEIRQADIVIAPYLGQQYLFNAKVNTRGLYTFTCGRTSNSLFTFSLTAAGALSIITGAALTDPNAIHGADGVLGALNYQVALPWGQTVLAENILTQTLLEPDVWRDDLVVSKRLSVETEVWQVLRRDELDDSSVLYLGMFSEPKADGSSSLIQRSIRIRYDGTGSEVVSISFYADEVETGSSGEGAVRYDAAQELTVEQMERALLNLGLKVVYINSSEFRTTLTEERANEILQADICIATYSRHQYAFYFSGRAAAGLSYFTTLQSNENVLRFTVSDTFALSAIVIAKVIGGGSVRYDTTQTLTDAQKARARANIGAASDDGLDIDWTSVTGGNVFVANEPTGSNLVAVPYNRVYIEAYTAGSFDTPTINVKTIAAGSTDKTTRIGYSFANNIGTPCLRAKCVTGAKIADKAVTADKLGNDVPLPKTFGLPSDLSFGTVYSTSSALQGATSMTFADWEAFLTDGSATYILINAGLAPAYQRYVTGAVHSDGDSHFIVDLGSVPDTTGTTVLKRAVVELTWDSVEYEVTQVQFKLI